MDVKDEFFDEIIQNETPMSEPATVKLPLPPEDFDAFGKVKKVRGRMLKKLLKCEIKHYLNAFLGFTAIILLLGIFFAVTLRIDIQKAGAAEEYDLNGWMLLSGILYLYTMIGVCIYAYIAPIQRYNNNFFKNEGYLTFSVPASMEEHVFAKRIGAILCSLAAGLIAIVSILLTVAITGGFDVLGLVGSSLFEAIGSAYSASPVHAVFFTIEGILSSIVGSLMMPCVFGAASCFLSKFTGKKKSGVTVAMVFIVVTIVESLFISTLTTDILTVFSSPVGIHIGIWLVILLQAGITVGCFFYELHFLKKKLDLK